MGNGSCSPEGGRRPESGAAVASCDDRPGFHFVPSGLRGGNASGSCVARREAAGRNPGQRWPMATTDPDSALLPPKVTSFGAPPKGTSFGAHPGYGCAMRRDLA